MVWPFYPLILEDKLFRTLSCSIGAAVCVSYLGCSTLVAAHVFLGLLIAVALVVQSTITIKSVSATTYDDFQKKVRQLEDAAGTEGPLRMFKATVSNTFRLGQASARVSQEGRIDLSGFCHVIHVNTEEMWCDVEASTTFETIVAETAKYNCMPLVVPELRTITVGGAIVGIGIESSSFKHGWFHDSLLEADMLLASGKVERVGPDAHPDLFAALPNSLGSFGYLVRIRVRIQRTKPYVRLTRKNYFTSRELVDELVKACAPELGHDFVDAVALSDTGGCVLVGDFVEDLPAGRTPSNYVVDSVFYKGLLVDGTDYMRTVDYIWRWDADWFWVTQIFPFLSKKFVRWLCGAKLLRSDMYKKFNDKFLSLIAPLNLNKNLEHVIQDIVVPLRSMPQFLVEHLKTTQSDAIGKVKFTRKGGEKITVPFWLCPVKGTKSPMMPQTPGELYINIGFWDACEGPITKGGDRTASINRGLEQVCDELGALKTLYSTVHFSEEGLYKRYGGATYKEVKAKYDPKGRLRGFYDRVAKP